jgi:hypothetical protein
MKKVIPRKAENACGEAVVCAGPSDTTFFIAPYRSFLLATPSNARRIAGSS